MQVKPPTLYIEHLWYPIIVRSQGSNQTRIVEMLGAEVNLWNEYVRNTQ